MRYDTAVARQRADDDAWNAEVERARAGFRARDAEAISWLVGHALAATDYPDWYQTDRRQQAVTCRPDSGDILVEFELPADSVIPATRRYQYDEDRAACVALPRPRGEVALLYSGLIASIALRTAWETLAAAEGVSEVIQTVTVSGRARGADAATGQRGRPELIALSLPRDALTGLNLAAVQPLACAAHLGARISPDPLALVPVPAAERPE